MDEKNALLSCLDLCMIAVGCNDKEMLRCYFEQANEIVCRMVGE